MRRIYTVCVECKLILKEVACGSLLDKASHRQDESRRCCQLFFFFEQMNSLQLNLTLWNNLLPKLTVN